MTTNDHSDFMFPDDFLFGAATAAAQVEGGWNSEGKGESNWDRLCHANPCAIDECHALDDACKSYELYKTDVQLVRDTKLDIYRFSLSWSRLFPTGETHLVNQKGVDYYNNLINELLENKIIPFITIYHWDLPQKLQDLGGWLNPLIVDYFEQYARAVFSLFGDRVKWWLTLNEPSIMCSAYNSEWVSHNIGPPGVSQYLAGHHILKAHARAYRLYRREFWPSQKGKISISFSASFSYPATDSQKDHEAAERSIQFDLGWFANPIFSSEGDYPAVMKSRIQELSEKEGRVLSRLPSFSKEEIEDLKGSSDFLSIQYYFSSYIKHDDTQHLVPSRDADMGCVSSNGLSDDSSVRLSKIIKDLLCEKNDPEGLRELLKWIKTKYNNPSVFVTENGRGSTNDTLEDDFRVNYFKSHLNAVLEAIHLDGCNVNGFIAWALMDNFEWLCGYTVKFGIYRVDMNDPNRKRTARRSQKYLKQVVTTRKL